MEKQVSSNPEEKAKEFQGKFNKITIFLSKFIFQENFDILKKSGFIDSYTSDPDVSSVIEPKQEQRLLFLLFKSKKMNLEDLKNIVKSLVKVPTDIIFSYELVNDYSMIVIDFPENYIRDYDYVIQGKYSKLSEDFKNKFEMTQEVLNSNKVRIAREYTLYHHIFNKTQWLKQFWMDRLGLCEIEDNVELWEQPDKSDLYFNVTSIV